MGKLWENPVEPPGDPIDRLGGLSLRWSQDPAAEGVPPLLQGWSRRPGTLRWFEWYCVVTIPTIGVPPSISSKFWEDCPIWLIWPRINTMRKPLTMQPSGIPHDYGSPWKPMEAHGSPDTVRPMEMWGQPLPETVGRWLAPILDVEWNRSPLNPEVYRENCGARSSWFVKHADFHGLFHLRFLRRVPRSTLLRVTEFCPDSFVVVQVGDTRMAGNRCGWSVFQSSSHGNAKRCKNDRHVEVLNSYTTLNWSLQWCSPVSHFLVRSDPTFVFENRPLKAAISGHSL